MAMFAWQKLKIYVHVVGLVNAQWADSDFKQTQIKTNCPEGSGAAEK